MVHRGPEQASCCIRCQLPEIFSRVR